MEQEIRTYIKPVCDEHGAYLLDVAVHGAGRNRIIRIVVDTASGVTLNECEYLSRAFSDIFFRKNLFDGNYKLEVTSPGVNKSLEADYEFERNIGRSLKIEYYDEHESKTVTGMLKRYENGVIELELPSGTVLIARKNVIKANVKLKW